MELNFWFTIDEVVYVKPDEILSHYDTPKFISYKVVSRLYEELSLEGNGAKSYVVRHIDPSTPGGGKLYKFSESELMSRDSYKALMEITKKSKQTTAGYYAQQLNNAITQTATAISSSSIDPIWYAGGTSGIVK